MSILSQGGNRRPVVAANEGRAQFNRNRVANYERRARKQTLNAIESAGHEVMWYSVLLTGRPCSCHTKHSHLLNEDGILTDEGMQEVFAGGPEGDDELFTVRFANYGQGGKDRPEPEDALFDGSIEDDSVIKSRIDREKRSTSANTVNCAVCKKTRYIGGYQPYNGTRIVLTPVDALRDGWSLKGFEVNQGTAPWSFVRSDDLEFGTMRFMQKIPVGQQDVLAWRLYDGHTELVRHEDWHMSFNLGMGWTTLQGERDLIQLGGRDAAFELQCAKPFTHLEMQFSRGEYFKLDMSNSAKSQGTRRQQNLDSLSLVLPPTIAHVNIGDVVIDGRTMRLYSVTSAESEKSATGTYEWTATADFIDHALTAAAKLPHPFRRQ